MTKNSGRLARIPKIFAMMLFLVGVFFALGMTKLPQQAHAVTTCGGTFACGRDCVLKYYGECVELSCAVMECGYTTVAQCWEYENTCKQTVWDVWTCNTLISDDCRWVNGDDSVLPSNCGAGKTLSCKCEQSCSNANQGGYCGDGVNCGDKYWCCEASDPVCSSTAPSKTTLLTPTDNSNTTEESLNFTWSAVSWGTNCDGNSNSYTLYLEADDSTPDVVVYTGGASSSIESVVGGNTYYWSVSASNGRYTSSSDVFSFTTTPPDYPVSGTVYLDNSGLCTDTSAPIQPGAGAIVSITGETDASVAGDGTYLSPNVDIATQVVTLGGLDPEYICSCPGSCQTSIDVVDAPITVDFFVKDQRDPWWQTSGGDVGGNNGNLSSNIPASCVPGLCYPFITRGSSDSSGILTYLSGTNGFGDGGSASEGTNFVAQSALRTTTRKEGYNYFFRLFEMGLSPVDDFPVKTSVGKPSVGPDNGRAYYSGGNLTLNGADWILVPGESIVVFVDGNLSVSSQITTPVSAFVAFVVSGDITFDVGTATVDSEVAQIEGVFVADGVIQTNAGTDKFVAEGTYVGWGGVVLSRDFVNGDNNNYPTEYFIYRPDFVVNAPARMKRPVIRWEEIAP